jgi:hypothetical protein
MVRILSPPLPRGKGVGGGVGPGGRGEEGRTSCEGGLRSRQSLDRPHSRTSRVDSASRSSTPPSVDRYS